MDIASSGEVTCTFRSHEAWPQSRQQLFRATYTRNHTQCGMTFAKRNEALAQLFFVEVLLGYISSIGGREAHVIPLHRREAAEVHSGCRT